ncbi:hypothetical protein BESB_017610 [Besnoitia besnoiti]|uniref:Cyclin, N-terminal domain-containing protein n=1 Tax=Besnoitia besnoiti TaxID=94643 RepID=A0A2A9M9U1_BESBE|nr:hypothetical protein BESB_017610 [Besnoitia besnoiti]PFH32443.1 hypothetical protein BESB_017610 [Besnoitia besnoiti]
MAPRAPPAISPDVRPQSVNQAVDKERTETAQAFFQNPSSAPAPPSTVPMIRAREEASLAGARPPCADAGLAHALSAWNDASQARRSSLCSNSRHLNSAAASLLSKPSDVASENSGGLATGPFWRVGAERGCVCQEWHREREYARQPEGISPQPFPASVQRAQPLPVACPPVEMGRRADGACRAAHARSPACFEEEPCGRGETGAGRVHAEFVCQLHGSTRPSLPFTDDRAVSAIGVVLNRLAKKGTEDLRLSGAEGVITVFHSSAEPSIGIGDYIERLARFFRCSNECFVLALIYIDRLVRRRAGFTLNKLNVHRLFITALTVASKFFDDIYYSNSFYAKVGGLSLKELNRLEVTFIILLDFRLHVLPHEFFSARTFILPDVPSRPQAVKRPALAHAVAAYQRTAQEAAAGAPISSRGGSKPEEVGDPVAGTRRQLARLYQALEQPSHFGGCSSSARPAEGADGAGAVALLGCGEGRAALAQAAGAVRELCGLAASACGVKFAEREERQSLCLATGEREQHEVKHDCARGRLGEDSAVSRSLAPAVDGLACAGRGSPPSASFGRIQGHAAALVATAAVAAKCELAPQAAANAALEAVSGTAAALALNRCRLAAEQARLNSVQLRGTLEQSPGRGTCASVEPTGAVFLAGSAAFVQVGAGGFPRLRGGSQAAAPSLHPVQCAAGAVHALEWREADVATRERAQRERGGGARDGADAAQAFLTFASQAQRRGGAVEGERVAMEGGGLAAVCDDDDGTTRSSTALYDCPAALRQAEAQGFEAEMTAQPVLYVEAPPSARPLLCERGGEGGLLLASTRARQTACMELEGAADARQETFSAALSAVFARRTPQGRGCPLAGVGEAEEEAPRAFFRGRVESGLSRLQVSLGLAMGVPVASQCAERGTVADANPTHGGGQGAVEADVVGSLGMNKLLPSFLAKDAAGYADGEDVLRQLLWPPPAARHDSGARGGAALPAGHGEAGGGGDYGSDSSGEAASEAKRRLFAVSYAGSLSFSSFFSGRGIPRPRDPSPRESSRGGHVDRKQGRREVRRDLPEMHKSKATCSESRERGPYDSRAESREEERESGAQAARLSFFASHAARRPCVALAGALQDSRPLKALSSSAVAGDNRDGAVASVAGRAAFFASTGGEPLVWEGGLESEDSARGRARTPSGAFAASGFFFVSASQPPAAAPASVSEGERRPLRGEDAAAPCSPPACAAPDSGDAGGPSCAAGVRASRATAAASPCGEPGGRGGDRVRCVLSPSCVATSLSRLGFFPPALASPDACSGSGVAAGGLSDQLRPATPTEKNPVAHEDADESPVFESPPQRLGSGRSVNSTASTVAPPDAQVAFGSAATDGLGCFLALSSRSPESPLNALPGKAAGDEGRGEGGSPSRGAHSSSPSSLRKKRSLCRALPPLPPRPKGEPGWSGGTAWSSDTPTRPARLPARVPAAQAGAWQLSATTCGKRLPLSRSITSSFSRRTAAPAPWSIVQEASGRGATPKRGGQGEGAVSLLFFTVLRGRV